MVFWGAITQKGVSAAQGSQGLMILHDLFFVVSLLIQLHCQSNHVNMNKECKDKLESIMVRSCGPGRGSGT